MAEYAPPKDLALLALSGEPSAVEAYLQALKERGSARRDHFGWHLGVELVDVRSERVTMRMPWRPELRRGGGIFHGGALMALADHVAGTVFNTDPRVPANGSTGLTTDFNASFLRAVEPGESVVATGWVLRRGKRVTFIQVDISGEASGRVVAVCRLTYVTVPRGDLPKKRPDPPEDPKG